jgi:hypothetical protein
VLAAVLVGISALGSVLVSAPQSSAIEGGYEIPVEHTEFAQIWRVGKDGAQDAFTCSGTTTSPHRILTATHCFVPNFQYYVLVGRGELGKGTRHEIARMESRGDLTVLAIDTELNVDPFDFSVLPSHNGPPPIKSELESYGWGKTCGSCGPSPILKSAAANVVDNDALLSDGAGNGAYQVRVRQNVEGVFSRLYPGDSGGPSGLWPVRDGWGLDTFVVYGVASSAANDNRDNLAKMSATYDTPGRPPVREWLREFGQMQVDGQQDNGADAQHSEPSQDTDAQDYEPSQDTHAQDYELSQDTDEAAPNAIDETTCGAPDLLQINTSDGFSLCFANAGITDSYQVLNVTNVSTGNNNAILRGPGVEYDLPKWSKVNLENVTIDYIQIL